MIQRIGLRFGSRPGRGKQACTLRTPGSQETETRESSETSVQVYSGKVDQDRFLKELGSQVQSQTLSWLSLTMVTFQDTG